MAIYIPCPPWGLAGRGAATRGIAPAGDDGVRDGGGDDLFGAQTPLASFPAYE